jgi:hypothetical protein
LLRRKFLIRSRAGLGLRIGCSLNILALRYWSLSSPFEKAGVGKQALKGQIDDLPKTILPGKDEA